MNFTNAIVPLTLGGSYVYMANTAAAFMGKKAYPYRPAPPPKNVDFKKYTLEEAASLDLETHCRDILRIYDPFVQNRKFPAIILGAPNGGIVNLAIAMGVPYLCSQFRIPILLESEPEGKSDKDDLEPYAGAADYVGEHWTRAYPWGSVSCLVDPIHDRMDLGEYAHVRMKFIDIPSAFKRFITDHLEPNGTIVFVNTTYPWLSHRLRDRVTLQVGGLGAISPDEYLTGSERINQFLKAQESQHADGWRLADYDLLQRPESEWSTEPELNKATQLFCFENGYEFLPIEEDHPTGYNLLASRALHRRHTADGGRCGGYSINIFWGLCPTLMLRSRLLGCWFSFTDSASLKISEQQLQMLLMEFPDVPKKAIMGYYWSYPGAKLLDIITPRGWLNMLSKYLPEERISLPGAMDLESTEHAIFQYEDELFEQSRKSKGRESKHTTTVEELHSMLS